MEKKYFQFYFLWMLVTLCLASPLYAASIQSSSEASAPMTTTLSPMPPLNEREKQIILHKDTEAPFTGQYWQHSAAGVYVCRQCGQALYRSEDKITSACGWPSFDDMLPGSILRQSDADGERTEIICSACKGHLGHVFEGERASPKNTRYCVNSVSMAFVPAERISSAIFAGGCFWGVEDAFSHIPGVLNVTSGYTGGTTENPTYAEVSAGTTGHTEAVRVRYDTSRVDYETLARVFFEIHDPTQRNRQGADIGTQYRSALFYANAEQQTTACKLVKELQAKGWDVVTDIVPTSQFYPAEEYHQDYAQRNGRGTCQRRIPRFTLENTGVHSKD